MAKNRTFTDEEVEIMEQNGISRLCALNRVKRLGWSREKAITVPPIKKRLKIVEDEEKAILKLESTIDTKEAYQRFLESRKDKSHLEKYPQSVKASDFYLYLKSKVSWS
ncbi:hypothetical protein O0A02_00405 [Staphylococcus pseudintermedius]|nr:hypothetical protein [Staphylococcus pseudintermedius]MDK3686832.1 hypothetical protein [Staphylococcus pseudintermedius]MDK3846645.1 hypothetical protein [Staphylococcus pseudintermedius]